VGREDPERAALARRAARYPFGRPAGPYVLTRRGALPLADPAAAWGPGAAVLDGGRRVGWDAVRQAEGAPAGPRVAVLSHGSNAAPEILGRKLRDRPAAGVAVPVLPLALEDVDAVWSAHVTRGYLPATIAPRPGTVLRAWALLLTLDELEAVNATENLGRNYVLGRLGGARARWADGTPCPAPLAYVSLHGALGVGGGPTAVAAIAAGGRTLPALDQPGVRELVRGALAPDEDPAAFAEALAAVPAAAAACTAGLRPTALPFSWPGWEPLVPAG
jgi:hypothetical protein